MRAGRRHSRITVDGSLERPSSLFPTEVQPSAEPSPARFGAEVIAWLRGVHDRRIFEDRKPCAACSEDAGFPESRRRASLSCAHGQAERAGHEHGAAAPGDPPHILHMTLPAAARRSGRALCALSRRSRGRRDEAQRHCGAFGHKGLAGPALWRLPQGAKQDRNREIPPARFVKPSFKDMK